MLQNILPVIIYCSLSLRPCQLPLKVADERHFCICTLRIARNFQRHRAVSLRQYGFLVNLFCKITLHPWLLSTYKFINLNYRRLTFTNIKPDIRLSVCFIYIHTFVWIRLIIDYCLFRNCYSTAWDRLWNHRVCLFVSLSVTCPTVAILSQF